MARTTTESVCEILGGNYDDESSLTPYIEVANELITRVNACASDAGVTLSSTTLELMERWMAAHYYTTMDPIYKSKSTGRASATFNDRSYKDGAIEIDTSGCLSAILNGNKKATLSWLGKPKSTQIDYVERD